MARVVVVTRDAERARELEAAGHQVRTVTLDPGTLRALWADPPDVVVVDLSRAPATGRDVALAIRGRKATRHVPFVFAGGDDIGKLRALLPQETYCTWSDAAEAVGKAKPSQSTAAPPVLAGYAHAPIEKKLGVKSGDRVALMGEPEGFRERLPPDVEWRDRPDGRCVLAIWFTRSAAELEGELEWIARAGAPRLWIAWPKGGKSIGLTQQAVRKAGMGAGMVDYKICSIDATWSAQLFTWR